MPYILTHPGYPCVFWQDYYTWGLALPGEPSGIDALVRAHEDHAGGDTQILYCDDDLYIMQRTGWENQSGLVFVLNNRGAWHGATVRTNRPNTNFSPVAWRGQDLGTPMPKHTDARRRRRLLGPAAGGMRCMCRGERTDISHESQNLPTLDRALCA